jgi:hypothetical protein
VTEPETTILGIKIATLVSSSVASIISVVLEWRSHDLLTAVGSIIAGVFVAVVATELTLHLLGVSGDPGSWGYAVAAAYGITGRNLILWLKSSSVNPIQLLKDILGFGKGGRNG